MIGPDWLRPILANTLAGEQERTGAGADTFLIRRRRKRRRRRRRRGAGKK